MTDSVIPLPFFDDTPLWRAFILYSMFVFDDVLNPDKLRSSLEGLIHRPGWRKLGARLRQNASGHLEYHYPAEFSTTRPALSFTHVDTGVSASDHPIAARIPRPSAKPAVVGDPDEFRSLFRLEGAPTTLAHYLSKDVPQLGLHVVSFVDRTIVVIYWPHTLMDALGKRAFLDAWVLMLEGRDDEVEAPVGFDTDPLADLGKHPSEAHKLENHRLSLLGLASYGMRNALDFVRTPQNRMVCIPKTFIEDLRGSAIAALAAETGEAEPYLSHGDVLCAWWTRLVLSRLSSDSHRTVVLNNAYSLRETLADDLLPVGAGSGYVSNATFFIHVLLPVDEVLGAPLHRVALAIRQAILNLGTRAQVEAFAALWRQSFGKLPPFFGDSGMHMITYSNWDKARLFETDFSAAVVLSAASSQTSGKPVYIQNNQFGLILPNAFPIIGRDGHGNFWLSGYLTKGAWATIEQQLEHAEV